MAQDTAGSTEQKKSFKLMEDTDKVKQTLGILSRNSTASPALVDEMKKNLNEIVGVGNHYTEESTNTTQAEQLKKPIEIVLLSEGDYEGATKVIEALIEDHETAILNHQEKVDKLELLLAISTARQLDASRRGYMQSDDPIKHKEDDEIQFTIPDDDDTNPRVLCHETNQQPTQFIMDEEPTEFDATEFVVDDQPTEAIFNKEKQQALEIQSSFEQANQHLKAASLHLDVAKENNSTKDRKNANISLKNALDTINDCAKSNPDHPEVRQQWISTATNLKVSKETELLHSLLQNRPNIDVVSAKPTVA